MTSELYIFRSTVNGAFHIMEYIFISEALGHLVHEILVSSPILYRQCLCDLSVCFCPWNVRTYLTPLFVQLIFLVMLNIHALIIKAVTKRIAFSVASCLKLSQSLPSGLFRLNSDEASAVNRYTHNMWKFLLIISAQARLQSH